MAKTLYSRSSFLRILPLNLRRRKPRRQHPRTLLMAVFLPGYNALERSPYLSILGAYQTHMVSSTSNYSLYRSQDRSVIGAFQSFYEQVLIPEQSASNIAWIGSIQGFFLIAVGTLVGPLYDQGYLRSILATGSFLVVLGLMMTSLCTKYWQLVLAQGVTVGIGIGCLFLPSIAVLPPYFTKRRALAVGLSLCGSSLGAYPQFCITQKGLKNGNLLIYLFAGGIIYPIIFYRLQPHIGFGWATRVLGFIALVTLLLPIAVMKMRLKPSSVRSMFDKRAYKELVWTLWTLAAFIAFIGLLIPYFYIQVFALEQQVVDKNLGSYLVPIVNVGSLFGRIVSMLPMLWLVSLLIILRRSLDKSPTRLVQLTLSFLAPSPHLC